MSDSPRLRIKLANGAEFEASGDPEFIRSERAKFLDIDSQNSAPKPLKLTATDVFSGWTGVVDASSGHLRLRAKLRSDKTTKDACLVLLAASQKLILQPRPTAAQLAKWLRASGYPISRVDRTLSEGLERGEILASGSRRARRYELTSPGFLKASLIANQLLDMVPQPDPLPSHP